MCQLLRNDGNRIISRVFLFVDKDSMMDVQHEFMEVDAAFGNFYVFEAVAVIITARIIVRNINRRVKEVH
ncbi:hypothetical protein GCM10007391_04750 [Alteromonas halophila]|uniref:Uncharacterized protein n=1 Tax=Alteromonas halophila TaxID=516698 RepID=A0A918JGY0_9ALTE|nr:hypothetical protein GCM10007391_04750 [Alteromonas halophila]